MNMNEMTNQKRRLADHLEEIRPKGKLKWDDEPEQKLKWDDEPQDQPIHHNES